MRASVPADLRQDLVELAVRYARLRVDDSFADTEQQSTLGPNCSREPSPGPEIQSIREGLSDHEMLLPIASGST